MTRVHVLVEGETEELFVKQIVAPILWLREIFLHVILIGSPGHKGGNTSYARVKKDIVILLKADRTSYCTTMIDLYGLGHGFPGTPVPENVESVAKVTHIEEAVKANIIAEVGDDLRADVRLMPYVQLHEFEGLLFSDPDSFASALGQRQLAQHFQTVRLAFATPEHINDHPNMAHSKRVLAVYPGYRKVVDGVRAARSVGIDRMRQECRHFREWVESLEALPHSLG